MDDNPPTKAAASGEKSQKSIAPITTIDVESDEEVVQQHIGKVTVATEETQKKILQDKQPKMVIPVEDEDESIPAKKDITERSSGTNDKEDKQPLKKKRVPEVISIDDDDEKPEGTSDSDKVESVVSEENVNNNSPKKDDSEVPTNCGTNTGSVDSAPDATKTNSETEPPSDKNDGGDGLVLMCTEVTESVNNGEHDAKHLEEEDAPNNSVPSDIDENQCSTITEVESSIPPCEKLESYVSKLDSVEAAKSIEDKSNEETITTTNHESAKNEDPSEESQKLETDVDIELEKSEDIVSVDSSVEFIAPEGIKIDVKEVEGPSEIEPEPKKQRLTTKEDNLESNSQEAKDEKNIEDEQQQDSETNKVNDIETAETTKQGQSDTIQNGDDKGAVLNKSELLNDVDKDSDVTIEKSTTESKDSSTFEEKSDIGEKKKENKTDVAIMDIEAETTNTKNAISSEKNPDKSSEEPKGENKPEKLDEDDDDDVVLIDLQHTPGSAIDTNKVNGDKSKESGQKSIKVDETPIPGESKVVTAECKEKNNEDSKPNSEAPDMIGENRSEIDEAQKAAKKDSTEKTFVLDDKSGMFEERNVEPEQDVNQPLTCDSDEDVVMIDDDTTPTNKSSVKVNTDNAKNTEKTSTAQEPSQNVSNDLKKSEENGTVKSPPKTDTKRFAGVDCINPECGKTSRETTPAPSFMLNYFGIPKKLKKQRICRDCYYEVVSKYSGMCEAIESGRPLLFCEMPQKNELVEISDSSEEEEDEDVKMELAKPLPKDVISLVESNLNDILTSTFERINLNQQVEWTEQIMKQKIEYNTKISDEINNELNELQRKVDRIHLQLYAKSRPRYQDLPPCNIFHEVDLLNKAAPTNQAQPPPATTGARQYSRSYSTPQKQQPTTATNAASQQTSPKDEFNRPAVVVGQFYFAVKHKLLSNWAECQVVEAVNMSEKTLFKVNFLFNQGTGSAPIKMVPAKYLAYRHSFNVKLPLGTRVIARFDAGTSASKGAAGGGSKTNAFYPGIIAESFGKYNRHRYLIFFDDGYAQYVSHGDVRVVCEESAEVWTDIHPHSQEFIKAYLQNYRSQRPMVQVKVGQRIITEWKGKWIYARVVDIDASLVQLFFPDDNRYEWIYRGSTRLGPLYQEKALSMTKMSNNKFSKFQKRNVPSIEYITLDDDDEQDEQNKQDVDARKITDDGSYQQSLADNAAAIRSVAKKSTASRPVTASNQQPSAVFMNSSTIYCEDDRPKGKIVYYTAKKHLPPLKYKSHECCPGCLFKITHNLKSYSPMAKPLLSGWERQLCKMKYKKVFVVYRAPCGRRLRNMYELHMYLRLTGATLNVENFDFDPMIHCLAEYVIENHIYHNPDLSDGKEYMAVPCVNYFDDTKPPPCIYSTERIPTKGVNLNLDTDFMCGCDCDDDCIDKSRCQCWQLTVAGAKFGNYNTAIDNIGYVYKRLQEPVVTGIYECNARCKCKNNCLNRVVQHPLQTKLQVFKTSNRGWGIRCLNDVSKGSFICIYSGHLLTEEAGNNICQSNDNKAGDEYFADLDYIETVEQLKEGYEADVVESESENDSDGPDYEARGDSDASDDDFTTHINPSDDTVKTRAQLRKDSKKAEKKLYKRKDDAKVDSDDEREMVNLIPNSDIITGDVASPSIKYRSVRKLFGKHEQIYIMDAKKSGNLGRYFNHSCNPNLFVQNVFVDTHDLRFPWVAFFALSNIRAGSELTWNYNYDVGSVPGKVLYCQCGAENCRQRLL